MKIPVLELDFRKLINRFTINPIDPNINVNSYFYRPDNIKNKKRIGRIKEEIKSLYNNPKVKVYCSLLYKKCVCIYEKIAISNFRIIYEVNFVDIYKISQTPGQLLYSVFYIIFHLFTVIIYNEIFQTR